MNFKPTESQIAIVKNENFRNVREMIAKHGLPCLTDIISQASALKVGRSLGSLEFEFINTLHGLKLSMALDGNIESALKFLYEYRNSPTSTFFGSVWDYYLHVGKITNRQASSILKKR